MVFNLSAVFLWVYFQQRSKLLVTETNIHKSGRYPPPIQRNEGFATLDWVIVVHVVPILKHLLHPQQGRADQVWTVKSIHNLWHKLLAAVNSLVSTCNTSISDQSHLTGSRQNVKTFFSHHACLQFACLSERINLLTKIKARLGHSTLTVTTADISGMCSINQKMVTNNQIFPSAMFLWISTI